MGIISWVKGQDDAVVRLFFFVVVGCGVDVVADVGGVVVGAVVLWLSLVSLV